MVRWLPSYPAPPAACVATGQTCGSKDVVLLETSSVPMMELTALPPLSYLYLVKLNTALHSGACSFMHREADF